MTTILANPPKIETSRLLIRPLTMADDEDIYEYGSDPEVTKYVLFDTHSSIEVSRAFINATLDQYVLHEPTALGIELKESQKLIGTVGYLNWSVTHKRIEIGYALARPYWNKGYVTEATLALIDRLFTNSDLVRIEARCRTENIGSSRVMEKAGMKFEGVLRKHIFVKGTQEDMAIYSIIRDEWKRQNNN